MRIVIGNLPDDVTEEGIQEALSALTLTRNASWDSPG